MILNAEFLSIWYSLLVKVWTGATTIESPVWTPTGSRFSIEHTIIAVLFLSLITSSSISLNPLIDLSTNTWDTGDNFKAFLTSGLNSSSLSANPPPVPPRVNAGLIIIG